MQREDLIKEIAYDAGNFIKTEMKKTYDVDIKNNVASDLVTSVDVAVEEFLVKKIKKHFPHDGFITEEASVSASAKEYTWIIDPIDGTMNFVYFQRDFAISIAIYKDNKPYIGLVYDVMNDEMFYAKKDQGAFLNKEAIKIEAESKLKNSIIDISLNSMKRFEKNYHANFHKITDKTLSQRNLGSAALRTVHTALGRVHSYMSSHLYVWDVAAGIVFLEELGGSYSLLDQDHLELNKKQIRFVAAQSKEILEEINKEFFKEEIC